MRVDIIYGEKIMKVKNVLIIFLSLALIASMAGAVSAAVSGTKEITNSVPNPEYTTVIFTHSDETYTVVIPSEVRFDATASANQVLETAVTATGIVLDSSRQLVVRAVSLKGWNLTLFTTSQNGDVTYDDNFKIKYTLDYKLNNVGEDFTPATSPAGEAFTILSATTGVREVTTPLKFTKLDSPPKIGSYNDLITFSAGVSSVS